MQSLKVVTPDLLSMSDPPTKFQTVVDYLTAARPDWKKKDLSAVEEKLGKVGIYEVGELVSAIRGKGEKNLNNRLRNVGEKCFTTETMSALRRPCREGGATGTHSPPADDDDLARDADKHIASPPPPAPSIMPPASKEGMRSELENRFGFRGLATCQARDLRMMLAEARRLEALPAKELHRECNAKSIEHSLADDTHAILVARLLVKAFPNQATMPAVQTSEKTVPTAVSTAAAPMSGAAPDGTTDPAQYSLSSLFHCSQEELYEKCSLRGIAARETDTKGVLSLKLKMDSRREQMKLLEERASAAESRGASGLAGFVAG